MEAENQVIKCPVCKSGNISDDSQYDNNGIFGHGSRTWKTLDIRSCNDCGVIFKPVVKPVLTQDQIYEKMAQDLNYVNLVARATLFPNKEIDEIPVYTAEDMRKRYESDNTIIEKK